MKSANVSIVRLQVCPACADRTIAHDRMWDVERIFTQHLRDVDRACIAIYDQLEQEGLR